MGYDVHITRKLNWFDEDGPEISEEEWRNYVASDPEMVITGFAEHTNSQGETIRLTHPLLTEWRHHPIDSIVWFSYFKGCLVVKNPDDACLAKMKLIATKLRARVQGDDGEFYDEINPPTPPPSVHSSEERPTGWFSRWLSKRRPKN